MNICKENNQISIYLLIKQNEEMSDYHFFLMTTHELLIVSFKVQYLKLITVIKGFHVSKRICKYHILISKHQVIGAENSLFEKF